MPGKLPVSKAQMRFMGAMASKGAKWAKNDLRGKHMKGLPERSRGGKKRK